LSIAPDSAVIRIGISSCLLGDEVRFDGGHKRNAFLTETLGPQVEWVRVCPEVELGLGVPRETLRLIKVAGDVRMITTKRHLDHTDAMRAWAGRRADALASMNLHGYVFKANSPSCGMERVTVFTRHGAPSRTGVGLFAAAIRRRLPVLPTEDEGRLMNQALRENFIERVFAYHRLQDLFAGRWTPKQVAVFHAKHRLALLAHSPAMTRTLDDVIAAQNDVSPAEFRRQYEDSFMTALARPATRVGHTRVLRHAARHVTKVLNAQSVLELRVCIEEYGRGRVPLAVPTGLLRDHARALNVSSLIEQTYLEPNPRERALRDHV
jgi:uncharacterized protein YbbK (DUF523 family)/uncharacterized protein YbgA (DUF1722 family)